MQKDEDLESLRENIIHGLRMQGWPKADAEDEAMTVFAESSTRTALLRALAGGE